jgi:hypothetical protein
MHPDVTTDPAFARDAFISYANQDTAVADALCASLEQRGLSCWIAPRDVMPGALYADSIVRAINGAKVLILVLSGHSVASSHVGKEIERASSKSRPIIALRIDAAPLTPSLEYFLSESQWVDASLSGIEAAHAKLAEAIQAQLGGAATRATGAAYAKPSRKRWPVVVAVGLATLVGVAVIAGAAHAGDRTDCGGGGDGAGWIGPERRRRAKIRRGSAIRGSESKQG